MDPKHDIFICLWSLPQQALSICPLFASFPVFSASLGWLSSPFWWFSSFFPLFFFFAFPSSPSTFFFPLPPSLRLPLTGEIASLGTDQWYFRWILPLGFVAPLLASFRFVQSFWSWDLVSPPSNGNFVFPLQVSLVDFVGCFLDPVASCSTANHSSLSAVSVCTRFFRVLQVS